MVLKETVDGIRNAMYCTMILIGCVLFAVGIMYVMKGRSVEATYFIVAFIIAEVLALSFKYCKCCSSYCYGVQTDTTDDEYTPLIRETPEQRRMKQEIYNNEPYSALLPRSHNTSRNGPTVRNYDCIASSRDDRTSFTDQSAKLLDASGIVGCSIDSNGSQRSFDSSGRVGHDEFPVINPESPPFFDVEQDMLMFHQSADNYFGVGHFEHRSVSRYNSFQSNSLPPDFRTKAESEDFLVVDLESSFRSFETLATTDPKNGTS